MPQTMQQDAEVAPTSLAQLTFEQLLLRQLVQIAAARAAAR